MNKLVILAGILLVLILWVMQNDLNNAIDKCNGDKYCEINVMKGV